MSKDKKTITASELDAKLNKDPDFVREKAIREEAQKKLRDEFRGEQSRLVGELREAGLDIRDLWELLAIRTSYRDALPILVRHLKLSYSDATLETIARALAVREALEYWSDLVDLYRRTPNQREGGKRCGLKHGLACALAVASTEKTLGELVELARDPSNGDSRVLLLDGIRRSRSALAKQAVQTLVNDPGLAREIKSWGRTVSKQ
jgi:hypothetical protein